MQPVISSNSMLVSGNDLRTLSTLTPWKSIFAIFSEWLLIIGCIFIHKLFPNILVYIAVWFVIGTRLYAMYSLIHDAIHYSISRNKSVNDFLGNIFLGFPLLISLTSMRKNHLNHHKFLQTEEDPEMKHLLYDEFHFPKTKFDLAIIFLRDISGFNFVYYKLMKLITSIKNLHQLKSKDIFGVIILLIIISATIYIGIAKDLLLYWFIPYATLYQVLNRIRLSTEHFNIDENNSYKTRSVMPCVIERFIFTPYNLGYHLEHHLYPSVPFYNLPKLHKLLISNQEYTSNAIVHKSYKQVFQSFIK